MARARWDCKRTAALQDRVTSRSMEGRRLRRHVLRGAVIVFVTAGYSGKRFIYEKVRDVSAVPVLEGFVRAPPLNTWAHRQPAPCQAKELGVRSVIIDGPDSWSQSMVNEGLVERFVGIDFSDADTIYDRCLAAIIKVKQVRARTAAQLQGLDGSACNPATARPGLICRASACRTLGRSTGSAPSAKWLCRSCPGWQRSWAYRATRRMLSTLPVTSTARAL